MTGHKITLSLECNVCYKTLEMATQGQGLKAPPLSSLVKQAQKLGWTVDTNEALCPYHTKYEK